MAVEHVLGMLAAGDTPETILAGYPWLAPEDIRLWHTPPSGVSGGRLTPAQRGDDGADELMIGSPMG